MLAALISRPSCPVPEVARLGRTLPAWRTECLASFDIDGAAYRPTEVINLPIGKRHRAAHGVRNVTDHRLRLLLAHGVPRQISPPHR